MPDLSALSGYPPELLRQVESLLSQPDGLSSRLLDRYPHAHGLRSDRQLYDFVEQFRARHLRSAGRIAKVVYDSKVQLAYQALGLHVRSTKVHGAQLKARHDIRIAALFRDAPPPFLSMIVVHELAHLRHPDHDRAFYQLCAHMEPDYHQIELDVRLYLTHLAAGGGPLWRAWPEGVPASSKAD